MAPFPGTCCATRRNTYLPRSNSPICWLKWEHGAGEDEEWDVVSDDSAAYLPMVVEALRSTAASKSPTAAARDSAAGSASGTPGRAGCTLGDNLQQGCQYEGVSGHGEGTEEDLERRWSLQPSAHDRSNSLDCSWPADKLSPACKRFRHFSEHCDGIRHQTQPAAVVADAADQVGALDRKVCERRLGPC